MSKPILITMFALALSFSLMGPSFAQTASISTQNLQSFVGKYPEDLFKSVPGIIGPMKALLGADYKSFQDRIEVQDPISNVQNHLLLHGCMAHSCGNDEAALVIDLTTGKLSAVTLAKDTKAMPIKVYGEDKKTPSAALQSMLEEYHRDL